MRAIRIARQLRELGPGLGRAEAVAAAQVRRPAQHVVDRRDDRALATHLFGREEAAPPGAATGYVHGGNARRDVVVRRKRDGVGHADHLEQARLQLLLERRAARALDCDRHQMVAAVVVDHRLAGGEVAALLAHQDLERVANRRCAHAVADEAQVEIAARPAAMLHQLAERGVASRAGELGDVGADRLVEVELAFLGEQKREQAGEVLGDRTDPHARRRRVGRPVLEARHAERAPIDERAILDDANHHPRLVGAVPRREQSVELFGDRLHLRRRGLVVCRHA